MLSRWGRYILLGGIAACVAVLDQLTKLWVVNNLPEYQSVPVIAGFFDLVNIRNRGAAFGFLNRSDIEWQFWLFMVATLVAVVAIVALVRGARNTCLLVPALGMVLGGAVGNLIDRIRFRSVVDFLDFYIGAWHWPAFNVADIAICCGALLACLSMYIHDSGRKSSKRG